MIELLENGNLIVPQRCEQDWIIWDWLIEIKKWDPKYDEYLSQYYHDKKIKEEKEKLFNDEESSSNNDE
jgi:hypothetical protein